MTQLTLDQAFALASQHHQAGRYSDAERIYRQLLRQRPDHADATHYLGVIAHQTGRSDLALEMIRRAIELQPNNALAHNSLGIVLKAKGRIDEAVAAYRQSIVLNPGSADVHTNLGSALEMSGRLDEAMAEYRSAIALNPNHAPAHNNLGNVFLKRQEIDNAIACYRRAIGLRPALADALNNLGSALWTRGEVDEAIAACRQAIDVDPTYADAHKNLAVSLVDKGEVDEAIASYRKALALRPSYPEAHSSLALALLLRGDYAPGWEEHEWRWKAKDFLSPARSFSQPLWDGRSLNGATILIHSEQGFGDAIQFLRYVPLVARRGGKIILDCLPELRRLAESLGVECEIPLPGQRLPPFDFHCPLLSLPRAFGTTLETIPSTVPYLHPEAPLVEQWREKITAPLGVKKVAIAWAGNPKFTKDRTRSLTIDRLAPLADARGVKFFSVQKGYAESQADHPPDGLNLVNLSPSLHDFADTAAAMSLVDLVITTDTSIAHLAGALGRQTWVMLQFSADWRWLQHRQDSPWYPTMRLFRQPKPGDWDSVIRNVRDELLAALV